jgi:hypothetical protein
MAAISRVDLVSFVSMNGPMSAKVYRNTPWVAPVPDGKLGLALEIVVGGRAGTRVGACPGPKATPWYPSG